MKQERILLFGGSGMLGARIIEVLSTDFEITAPTRSEINLLEEKSFYNPFEKEKFDYVVYAAGITNQEYAEKNHDEALQLNKISPELIARRAGNMGIPMIYFSTDAVFNGKQKTRPYIEYDKLDPLNYYGETKAAGENAVLSASNKNLVIRLDSIYTAEFANKTDFVRRIIKSASKGLAVKGITDQYLNPTFSDVASNALDKSLRLGLAGIIHVGSSDYHSNLEFAELVIEVFGLNKKLVEPITFAEFYKGSSVKRGKYQWLDVSKAIEYFGASVIKSSPENLREMKEQLKRNV